MSERDLLDILDDPSRLADTDEAGFGLSPKIGKVLGIKEDRSDVSQEDVIVLKPPTYMYNKELGVIGYQFPKTIKSIVSYFFQNN